MGKKNKGKQGKEAPAESGSGQQEGSSSQQEPSVQQPRGPQQQQRQPRGPQQHSGDTPREQQQARGQQQEPPIDQQKQKGQQQRRGQQQQRDEQQGRGQQQQGPVVQQRISQPQQAAPGQPRAWGPVQPTTQAVLPPMSQEQPHLQPVTPSQSLTQSEPPQEQKQKKGRGKQQRKTTPVQETAESQVAGGDTKRGSPAAVEVRQSAERSIADHSDSVVQQPISQPQQAAPRQPGAWRPQQTQVPPGFQQSGHQEATPAPRQAFGRGRNQQPAQVGYQAPPGLVMAQQQYSSATVEARQSVERLSQPSYQQVQPIAQPDLPPTSQVQPQLQPVTPSQSLTQLEPPQGQQKKKTGRGKQQGKTTPVQETAESQVAGSDTKRGSPAAVEVRQSAERSIADHSDSVVQQPISQPQQAAPRQSGAWRPQQTQVPPGFQQSGHQEATPAPRQAFGRGRSQQPAQVGYQAPPGLVMAQQQYSSATVEARQSVERLSQPSYQQVQPIAQPDLPPTSQVQPQLQPVTLSQSLTQLEPPQGQQKKKTGRGKQQGKTTPVQETAESQVAGGDTKRGSPAAVEVRQSAERSIADQSGGDVPAIQPKMYTVARRGGTNCRKRIMVVTNHFPLSLGKLTKVLQYDVVIDPDKPKKLFRPIMEAFRCKHYKDRYPAFDGSKSLYSAYQLCSNELTGTVKIVEDDREREYKVTIKQVAYVDLSCLDGYFKQIGRMSLDKPMQALHCLDIILRSAPALSCIPVGRSYFNRPIGSSIHLGDGAELYYGFYQSAILGWKPFLNVDVAHKAFPTAINIVDFIYEINRQPDKQRELQSWEMEALSKHVKQLKVQYEIPGIPSSKRVYRVNDLGPSPQKAKFKTDAGEESTVYKYFEKEKRQRLQFAMWPTLWVGSRNRESKILLPIEFCKILPDQPVNRKMTEEQTRAMIKHASTSAPERRRKIQESMTKANYNSSPQVREFGIKVSEVPEEVEARVLEAPTLEYGANRTASVARGVWRGNKFKFGASVDSWTIICLDNRTQPNKLIELENYLIESGVKSGMSFQKATKPDGRNFKYFDERNDSKLKEQLIQYFKTTQNQLTVVVIPERKFTYHAVKQASEINVGRLTQCVKAKTVFRLNSSTTDNIILKINAKLNGTNHILSTANKPACLRRPVVIMGADVTHPSPDARDIPSVAAVTCSYDQNAFKYIFSWRLQGAKEEIIQDLETIVMEQLRYFKSQNNCAPERIIFFRDGVSDGQFQQVLSSELQAIRSACAKLSTTYKPKITFLVVQKRHHTRLFPKNGKKDSEDRNENVPAGTCVDTVITHPSALDFFLVSHASIQGVARPTKYRMLWDDADMSEDDIEELTYYLCHMFARCNRSVSYPTPTYYAHLAAARAKVYCETERIDMNNLKREQEKLTVKDNIIRKLPMYFV